LWVEQGDIDPYGPQDDVFSAQTQVVKFDPDVMEYHGLKIKKDWFFDNERCVMESRINGIYPTVIDKETGEERDLYWLYFPQLRPLFAGIKVVHQEDNPHIRSLDDLSFFRDFASEIIKESNVYDRFINDYFSVPDIADEAQRIEVSIIEAEHESWLNLTVPE
jgi:hypothetical protein